MNCVCGSLHTFPWGWTESRISLETDQELRVKNWSAMEALAATESMLQGKLSKALKVRIPLPVCFTLDWKSDASPNSYCHNRPVRLLHHFYMLLHTHFSPPSAFWPWIIGSLSPWIYSPQEFHKDSNVNLCRKKHCSTWVLLAIPR